MKKDETVQQILREYDAKHSLYSAFTTKQEHLIAELLQERSFSPHSVTSRVKSRKSLEDKLRRTDASYARLSDITDVTGVRITTYFSDDVDKIAEHLEKEFEIVKEHSVDKRKTIDADRFGYLSLHYVVKLSGERLKLTEYRRFPDLVCEIQVRSILQHAWAEIEHDLGYKSRIEVPQILRRRFSRLAGLLELADQEFVTIREGLSEYQKNLPKEIRSSSTTVTIDKLSLAEFLKSNRLVKSLDEQIAAMCGSSLVEDDAELIENDLVHLNFLGIKNISELEVALRSAEKFIPAFAKEWIGSYPELCTGICLLYMSYVIIAQSGNKKFAVRFLDTGNFGGDHEELASKIFSTYAAVQKNQPH
jgi:ppGpp synthetase/RelA/SpoT-type nucleotidyltranferase